jgi:hypothetical protein
VEGLTPGSLNHHHLSLNEHVCIYLSLFKIKDEKEGIIVNTQMLQKQNDNIMTINLPTTEEVTLRN